MRAIFLYISIAFTIAWATEFPLIEPKELADQLAKGAKPVIVQVGPHVLYQGKHIPAALHAGPASKQEGLDLLKSSMAKVPRGQAVVIYCGCCPWEKCPNIKPAIEVLKGMGFTHVTAMHVPTNIKTDWIDQGYPVEHK